VDDLGVELDAVETPIPILEGRDRRRGRAGHDPRAEGRRGHRVTVAHPADLLGRQALEELAPGLGGELRTAELRRVRALDAAAEVSRHQLHPVADPEHRDAELEDPGIDPGRPLGVDRRRPSGEDERQRPPGRQRGRGGRVRHELRVHAALAHPSRDQLRVLAAEVDDEDGPLLGRLLGSRKRYDLAHYEPGR
jgi:hypothetical protein